jgi:hypothetical protein
MATFFVTYAKQDKQKHDDVAGNGHGFVDVFDTDGHLLHRFASRGTLNSPWGVTRASFAFGPFSGKILVGNFGNGHISVFDNDGTFVDQLEDAYGNPISIDGLWTLTLGGGRIEFGRRVLLGGTEWRGQWTVRHHHAGERALTIVVSALLPRPLQEPVAQAARRDWLVSNERDRLSRSHEIIHETSASMPE